MIKMQIGQMIYDIRTTMKITQEELSYGLCDVSALSKYENVTPTEYREAHCRVHYNY